jgi:hypothetical protein
MNTTINKNSISAMLLSIALFTACDNDSLLRNDESEEVSIAEVSSLAENETDEALEIMKQVEYSISASANSRVSEWDYPCASITHDEIAKTITLDFGTSCVGPYGRTRSGKMNIQYSGELNDNVSNRIITFENYSVNNKGVIGQIELRDIAENLDGTIQSTKKLVDLTVSFPNGKTVTYNGSRTRLWMEGLRDEDPTNNVFEITGSIEGLWSTGRSFTHKIVEPIIIDWSCASAGKFARISGLVEIEKLNGFISRTRTINYGNGECDNSITVTIGNRTFEITEID